MELTLEKLAEKVYHLEGQSNGIVADIKDIKEKVVKLEKNRAADKNDILLIIEKNKNEIIQKNHEILQKTEIDKSELIERMVTMNAEIK